jgi:flagellar protein FlaG
MADSVSNINSLAPGALMTALAAAQVQSSTSAQTPAPAAPASAAPATKAQSPGTSSATDAASGQTAAAAKLANLTTAETAKLLGPAVKSLQDYIKPQQTATIQVDHATGQSYVKIVNAQTQQLVLQIPSAQVLAMAQKLQQIDNPQAASGVLVDQEG